MNVRASRKLGRFSPVLIAAVVAILSALLFAQYGFNGTLIRDDAIYVYSGQRLAEGVPPYVSAFDHKGPLAPILAGLGVMVARGLSMDDVIGARIPFFVLGSLSVGLLYLLAKDLFRSQVAGLLAAALFVNLWGYGRYVVSGPQAKTPVVFFELAVVLCLGNKRWFWSGFFGALAALTWQPMALLPLIGLILAYSQARSPGQRRSQLLWSLGGSAVPVLAVLAYFAYAGALPELVEGAVVFNLRFLDRRGANWISTLKGIRNSFYIGYSTMAVPLAFGIICFAIFELIRTRTVELNLRQTLRKDRYAVLWLAFPAFILISLLDFQRFFDLYPLLPFASLGFAWMLTAFIDSLGGSEGLAEHWRVAIGGIMVFSLVALAFFNYRRESPSEVGGLFDQREWTQHTMEGIGEDATVVSIGAPQALVLLGKTNPNRYIFITNGIDELIAARTPGGFAGWLDQLAEDDPAMIFYGATNGRWIPLFNDWLLERYVEVEDGEWQVFVGRGTRPAP